MKNFIATYALGVVVLTVVFGLMFFIDVICQYDSEIREADYQSSKIMELADIKANAIDVRFSKALRIELRKAGLK